MEKMMKKGMIPGMGSETSESDDLDRAREIIRGLNLEPDELMNVVWAVRTLVKAHEMPDESKEPADEAASDPAEDTEE